MIILKNKNNISNEELKTIEQIEFQLFLHNGYNVENLNNLFSSPNFHCAFYIENEMYLGYCLFFVIEKEVEIYKIGVLKEYQRKKIGTKLLEYLKENNNSIFLETSDRDYTVNFYLKNKFKLINTRKNYYSDNSNALILKWIKLDI